MNIKSLYLLSVIILVMVLLVVFVVVYKKNKVKNLREKLDELERQRNLIVATPVMTELSKIDVIVKNAKLEDKYEEWKKRYETIKNERYNAITDKLLEVDTLIETR